MRLREVPFIGSMRTHPTGSMTPGSPHQIAIVDAYHRNPAMDRSQRCASCYLPHDGFWTMYDRELGRSAIRVCSPSSGLRPCLHGGSAMYYSVWCGSTPAICRHWRGISVQLRRAAAVCSGVDQRRTQGSPHALRSPDAAPWRR